MEVVVVPGAIGFAQFRYPFRTQQLEGCIYVNKISSIINILGFSNEETVSLPLDFVLPRCSYSWCCYR
ncbi:hypothetical protein QQF64_019503 [Cirrhinus molitorella]|uniref:Uncharacterized protein n=1 Tax=Cirrhinus molitorella TaxID=172907 RepID=A0ABR3LFN0_9TELE